MHSYLEKIKNDSLPIIQFDSFSNLPFVIHGFTTRMGGVSEGIYSSLNLSFTRGDDRENVLENYMIISQHIGIDISHFVASDQTHTTNIRIVDENDCGKGIIKSRDYTDVDGLMTHHSGIVLFTYYADCVPLFFVDTQKKVVAVSHSGWRGTLNRMGKKTVEKMCDTYGSDKNHILCAIGPSICRECYEVSEEVKEAFERNFDTAEMEQIFFKKQNGKYLLDLWCANELILLEAGILPENIENRRICTCCNKELLFSHRGLNGRRGNLAGFIGIK